MRKLNLLVVFMTICMISTAQDYRISFEGSGASTDVDSVIVKNLEQGTSMKLGGSDVLHLQVPTNVIQMMDKRNNILNIYPNPMVDKGTFSFNAVTSGVTIISVIDMTGRKIIGNTYFLKSGPATFRIANLERGFYFINVRSKSYSYSEKY